MTVALDNYQRLKRRVEELTAEAAEAKGAVKEVERRLKEEYGCDDLPSAKALLAKLQKKRDRLADEYHEAKRVFEEKWNERLGDIR